MIDSKTLERALREKPDSTFSQRALPPKSIHAIFHGDYNSGMAGLVPAIHVEKTFMGARAKRA